MTEVPRIETERLLLRPFAFHDAKRVQLLAGDPDVALMTSTIPYPYEDGAAEGWIASHAEGVASGRNLPFAVELGGEGLIGAVGLEVQPLHGRAEIGYWVGRPYWGCGFATEACRAVVAYGFTELGLRRIYGRHLAENPASGRVLQKVGMVREGLFRQHAMHRGERPADIVWHGVLAEEFRAV